MKSTKKTGFNDLRESDITLAELDAAASQMGSGKSQGPDSITVEFYRYFWNIIKKIFSRSDLGKRH